MLNIKYRIWRPYGFSNSYNNIKRGILNFSSRVLERHNLDLYLMILPAFTYFVIFCYIPIYGVQIAFKDFIPSKGILGSEWVGLYHFIRFFDSFYFWLLIKNTIGISIYTLIAGFPIPIILALLLNELKDSLFKRAFQTISYAPYFISVVVLTGMIISFLSPSNGIINQIIVGLGGESVQFLSKPELFKSIYVFSGIWQGAGWGSIIYLAVLSSIDQQMHEAAIIDGATRVQRIWHINIPCLIPTIVIILILNFGSLMSVGFEKVLLMQNPLNIDSSEIISTYVYKSGLLSAQFSFASAVGLFNSIVNFILLFFVNYIFRKVNETSLW